MRMVFRGRVGKIALNNGKLGPIANQLIHRLPRSLDETGIGSDDTIVKQRHAAKDM